MSGVGPTNRNRNEIATHVSTLIGTFVPSHIRERNPKLIQFIKAYLEFLEFGSGAGYFQNTIPEQRSLEFQEKEFLSRIENEIGLYVPREYAASPRLFYNKIVELWRSKGSKESIKLFFKLFLNDPVEIRFPWDRVLKTSDGRWVIDNKLRISIISGTASDFLGQRITQIEQFASSRVEKVERRVYADGIINELSLLRGDTVGDFIEGNTITVPGTDALAEIYRSVSEISIVNGGTGYKENESVVLKNYDGNTFLAYVEAVDENGSIQSIGLSNFGAGNTPKHIIESGNIATYFEDFRLISAETDQPISTDALEFEINTVNGSGAELELVFDSIVQTQGRYDGVRGQLSDSIVLQDSKFFQKFSYEVVTQFPIDVWEDTLRRTVHPSGVEVFSNIRIFEKLDLQPKSFLHSDFAIPPAYTFGENIPVTENSVGFTQSYAENEEFYFFEDYVGSSRFNVESVNTTVPQLPEESLSL